MKVSFEEVTYVPYNNSNREKNTPLSSSTQISWSLILKMTSK